VLVAVETIKRSSVQRQADQAGSSM